MNSYLATVDVGKFDDQGLQEERHPLLRRDRSGAVRPGRQPTAARTSMISRPGRQLLQAPHAHDRRARRRRDADVRRHARHRAELGLPVRRGAHGRRRRLDDAARPQRAHEQRRRPLVPVEAGRGCIRSSPTTRPTTATARAAARHDRLLVRRDRVERRAGRDWKIDLSAYAGKNRRALDRVRERRHRPGPRRLHRRHRLLDGRGHDVVRARRRHAGRLDGAGAPAGSPRQHERLRSSARSPTSRDNFGPVAQRSFAREPEILSFLASNFGPYPFRDAGGIVDHLPDVGFALENQKRPVYAQEFFYDPVGADSVVVHELAHQWYGDSVSVHYWADIWLNEGFASYAEWLWSEHEGLGTAQEIFDATTRRSPPTTRSGRS